MELRAGHCRVIVDFGFPAVVLLLLLWGDGTLLRQAAGVCLLHEMGHALAMCLSGAGIREIRFYAAGIQLRTHTVMLSRGALLLLYLSGPAVNLLCAVLFRGSQTGLLHLCMGVFNLLPFRILDGGAALHCLTEGRAETVLRVVCLLLSAAGAAAGIRTGNPAVWGMAVYLAIQEWHTTA